jgi:ubiquinone/menaquinone biosynthesis C-methylase UbiE
VTPLASEVKFSSIFVLREIGHFARNVPAALRLRFSGASQAEVYERVMDGADMAGLADHRAELARGLTGRVLEIGSGTGRMFPYYAEGVELAAVEPDERFTEAAERATARAKCRVDHVRAAAETLPFPDATFDAAVCGLVLCSVGDPTAVLRELGRVLRPSAELRLLEHVVSERPIPAVLMRAVDPLWLRLNGQGCRMSRDPMPALEDAGFRVTDVTPFQIFAPILPAFPMRRIFAASRSR